MFDHFLISSTSIGYHPSFLSSHTARNQGEIGMKTYLEFNGKEKDYESGFHYYGARYYWSETLMGWLSVDPMADKYPSLSPYNYCAWNPVKLVDPDGREIGDYYDKNGKWLFSDGKNDGKIYVEDNGNGIFMGPYEQPFYRCVGTVESVELSFTGNANNSKNKVNAAVSTSTGTLSLIQNCSDGNAYTRFSIDATSGGYGNGSLENGKYTVAQGWKRNESGYVKDGFGFCFPIVPQFITNRSELLIHPDGNSPGTLGCIGINAELSEMKAFFATLQNNIKKYSASYPAPNNNHNGQSTGLLLTVNINNNVNNDGSNPNKVNRNE